MDFATAVSSSSSIPYEPPQLLVLGTVRDLTESQTCFPIAGGKTWGSWDATWQIPITSNCSV